MTKEGIKAAREAAGLSRKALAASLGVTYSAVYAWETGTAAPGETVRQKLREVFGVSPPHYGKEGGRQRDNRRTD